jgi:hypothetical protein
MNTYKKKILVVRYLNCFVNYLSHDKARGQVLGDGIRVHSLVLPGLPSSTTVHFSGPGEVYVFG